jgi:hypothetical protein
MAIQNNSWTREEDQQLRTMLLGGKSVPAILARLKRTMGAIRSCAGALGLSVSSKRDMQDKRNATKRG